MQTMFPYTQKANIKESHFEVLTETYNLRKLERTHNIRKIQELHKNSKRELKNRLGDCKHFERTNQKKVESFRELQASK